MPRELKFLVHGPDLLDGDALAMLAEMFTALTGRKPTEAEIEEARQELMKMPPAAAAQDEKRRYRANSPSTKRPPRKAQRKSRAK